MNVKQARAIQLVAIYLEKKGTNCPSCQSALTDKALAHNIFTATAGILYFVSSCISTPY